MKNIIAILLMGLTANAATIGESSFTVWTSTGVASIDIRETDDGKILGRSSFGTNGLINLKYDGLTIEGYSDDGFTEVSCTLQNCTGVVGSDTVDLELKDNGQTLEGTINHVYVRASTKNGKIKIQADGSLDLSQDNAETFSGSCMIEPAYISQALLKSSGSLIDRVQKDPAFFIVYLISPLVRN